MKKTIVCFRLPYHSLSVLSFSDKTLSAMITYLYTTKDSEFFIELCHRLNRELNALLTGGVNPITTRANKTDDFSDVILAFDGNRPVGCIALRPFSSDCAEIKRMYVEPTRRKSGIGMDLLTRATELAVRKGYRAVVLETNEKLPEAKKLYLRAGFSETEPYGPYAALEETLCMKKELSTRKTS